MWASYQGHTRVVQYLLSRDVHVDAIDEHGITSLSWASGRNHMDIVTLLLDNGALTNLCDKNNTSPLIWASRNGKTTFEYIRYDMCFLYYWIGYTRVVDLLLRHNASVNIIGMKNMTALLVATKNGHGETALRLLENQTIDIKIQDKVIRFLSCYSNEIDIKRL